MKMRHSFCGVCKDELGNDKTYLYDDVAKNVSVGGDSVQHEIDHYIDNGELDITIDKLIATLLHSRKCVFDSE